ncbi:Metal-response element-binding transcription factor 2 [Frankliniella fusca]|uniref:Metal-response element-binding transcription factor 2 n=1 Tax=Frankliniella fusca TaxID=407009 RepID=A0AAE1HMS5_9NEOP|nr:Metal-response element-binding transcription factor 2 [Frankliniella fusca]
MNMHRTTLSCYVLLEPISKTVLNHLVNNHQLLQESVTEEAPAAPDSTTSMFLEGEDVLVDRNHTGQFFMGTIVQIDRPTEKCLLRFLDNKECWAHLNELQRVKDDPEEILCVVCKKIDQNVVPCPKCGRGYHRSCLEPSLPDDVLATKWQCTRCGNKSLKKKRARLSLASTQSSTVQTPIIPTDAHLTVVNNSNTLELNSNGISHMLAPIPTVPTEIAIRKPVRSLPYSLQSLVWDDCHRVNDLQLYCYCGKPGDWYMQMLQCQQCRQWFHQDCLTCLHFPLYCGDQLYLFLCSVCNDDEFLRRFDFGWVDIVHLVIFNLMIFKKKKYFDLDSEIIPYVKNNWFYLQIPAQLVKCSDSELRRIILKMLEDNSTKSCKFKSGRELKTKKRIWGLRIGVPPKRKAISLPPVCPLTDDAIRTWWKRNHITFRAPLDSKYLMRGDFVLQPDGCMSIFDYGLMIGQSPNTLRNISRNLRDYAIGIHNLDSSIVRNITSCSASVNGGQASCLTTEGFTGYAKKSSALCASNRLALQESLRRNKRARNRISPRSKALGKKDLCGGDQSDDVQENSSQDGYESLDSQTSYSHDDNYPSSNADSLDADDCSQDGYDSSGEESDAGTMESASTSAPDEDSVDVFKPVTNESNQNVSEEHFSKETVVGQTLQVKEESEKYDEENNGQCSDYQLLSETPLLSETVDTPPTASPATDSVFPSISSTPADTEADEDSAGPSEPRAPLPTIADLIGAPLVLDKEKEPEALLIPSLPRLTAVIKEPPLARAVKRKLSEKDIKIVNGQVKQRRRFRRVQSNQTLGTKTVHLDSGEKLEKRIVGGKLLRSPHKPSIPETTPDVGTSQGESSTSSPFARPEEMSVSDVKKNIKSIFNARNRIAAGEKFLIKGRRVTADGVEYLIQWDYAI